MAKKETLDVYQKKVVELVADSSMSFFVTGKAGTGKTTVLQRAVETARRKGKQVAVIAPTGIAAKHAGGITIHSFLHLKTAPFIPGKGKTPELYQNYDNDYLGYLKELDTIIIDEVSMVRCDIMDAMDALLRTYHGCSTKPFGGIQMVYFGDLYQLMPVADDKDQMMLDKHYSKECYYFFNSDVIRRNPIKMLELQNIYRQGEDKKFADLLNNIREGKITKNDWKLLESRYIPDFVDDDQILLKTHNWMAKSHNSSRLKDLGGKGRTYKAECKPFFPSSDYPTLANLELKVGAKVMFIKNDTDNHQYVNGTLGEIITLHTDYVTVKTEDYKIIDVYPALWKYEEYKYNSITKKVEIVPKGSFEQLPLRLAWAVTIHKSQGLTFNEVTIDASKSFAAGQVYVALSRCKTLKGLTLTARINPEKIQTNDQVREYLRTIEKINLVDSPKTTKQSQSTTHVTRTPLSSTIKETLSLIKGGITDLRKLAKKRDRSETTIASHIGELVAHGELDVYDFVDKQKVESLYGVFEKIGSDAFANEIMSECPIGVTYDDIKIVRGYFQLKQNQLPKSTASKTSKTSKSVTPSKKVEKANQSSPKNNTQPRPWTAEEDSYLIQLKEEGYNYSEIAELMNRDFFDTFGHYFLVLEPAIMKKKLEEEKKQKEEEERRLREEEEKKRQEEQRRIQEEQRRIQEEKERKALELKKQKEEAERLEAEKQKKIKEYENRRAKELECAVQEIFFEEEQLIYSSNKAQLNNSGNNRKSNNTLPSDIFEYSKDKTTITGCSYDASGDIKLPEGVEHIDANAFLNCDKITGVILPNGLKTIGDGAFLGCKKLRRIAIPRTVTHIGASAFDGSYLVDVSNTTFRSQDGALYSFDQSILYSVPKQSKTFEFPSQVRVVKQGAFSRCSELQDVELPQNISVIEDEAFKDCTSLKSATIPKGVEKIGNRLFEGCENLKDIFLHFRDPKGIVSLGSFLELKQMETFVHIPEGCLRIFLYNPAFSGIRVRDDIKEQKANSQNSHSTIQAERWSEEEDAMLKECIDPQIRK